MINKMQKSKNINNRVKRKMMVKMIRRPMFKKIIKINKLKFLKNNKLEIKI